MKSIYINELSNSHVVSSLIETWGSLQDSYLSSHWKKYGPQSIIHVKNKTIDCLRGIGFGDCQQTSSLSISKIFHYLTILTYLAILHNRTKILSWMAIARLIIRSCRDIDIFFSYDVFRQCCIVSILEQYVPQKENPRILLIGDGYGILAGILKLHFSNVQVVLVDIFPALLFQAIVLGRGLPKVKHSIIQHNTNKDLGVSKRGPLSDIIYCHAKHLPHLKNIKFDIVINVASMQEMTSDIVKRYFNFIRSSSHKNNLFYCCNRETKVLPDGETLRFEAYPWHELDEHLFDEEPPFYKWFFSSKAAGKKLKIFNISVPFGWHFDGKMRHRLTRMHTNS
jgi:SAM-dependent methyltransferase